MQYLRQKLWGSQRIISPSFYIMYLILNINHFVRIICESEDVD